MGWFEWLAELLDLPQPPRPAPGTHEARLEELRVGALLKKELAKPAGQRDEALVWRLRVDVHERHLANAKADVARCARHAAFYEQPDSQQCCAAAGWVRQRVAASYRAQHGYHSWIVVQQSSEELAAAHARRPAVIAAEPMLRLELSGTLQQVPPRMDMCSECAQLLEQLELTEGSCQACADVTLRRYQEWGMQKAVPTAAAVSSGAAAAAAADLHMGEQQQQQQCVGDSDAGGAEGGPVLPRQQPPQ
ncbi:hypothetical protein COHA_001375 [Chlorella ohadii]|uniref:Uncharacterized protein n=1 Tax=Chlorella ohadii TaxID=2649997 RepID=A0AAD5E210_9CHLO|nr:hypothetical protein COHA_001375 [Chlorella ohadii]